LEGLIVPSCLFGFRVLFGVLFRVLFGVLFGVLYGALFGALPGVLFRVFFGALYRVLFRVFFGIFFGALYRLEALTAIYRTVLARFERNLGRYTAISADNFMQFAGAAFTLMLTGITASLAPAWFVGESAGGVKLLFPGSEDKFTPAIGAR
jgi:hypothetical protein